VSVEEVTSKGDSWIVSASGETLVAAGVVWADATAKNDAKSAPLAGMTECHRFLMFVFM
jgi:hypothetical protein